MDACGRWVFLRIRFEPTAWLVHYDEGVAIRIGPEPCVSARSRTKSLYPLYHFHIRMT